VHGGHEGKVPATLLNKTGVVTAGLMGPCSCAQLVNRKKNKKKKSPTPLTEDMLNELNKNHMGGLDNCAADDLYNMDDVWNDKPPMKVTSYTRS
jgi:hypothetical protein